MNFLTIDLEDYFQVHAFSNVIRFGDWDNYESRIERNTHHLLEILEESRIAQSAERIANELTPCAYRLAPHGSVLSPEFVNSLPLTSNLKPQTSVRATFFVLGWIAERYPHLIRTIKEEGHEIACHGYGHKLIYTQSKEEFREDIRKAKAILEDLTGGEVIGYRAPSYSITQKSKWALEILMEEGFKYDSSIFPIYHDFYGFPNAPRFPFLISQNGNNNFEFSLLDLGFDSKTYNSQLNIHDSSNPTNSMNPSNPTNSMNPSNPTNSSNPMNPTNSSNPSAAPQHDVTPHSAFRTPHSSTQSSVLVTHNLQQQQNILASNEVLLKRSPVPNDPGRSAPPTSNDISVPPSPPCSMPHASSIVEFPISTVRILGVNIPISGGGYFRLFPYFIIKKGLARINRIEGMPFIFYLHPWELDDEQPRINSTSMLSKFRHYVNLNKTEERFEKLLTDFNFSPIKDLLKTNISTS